MKNINKILINIKAIIMNLFIKSRELYNFE